MQFSTSEHIEEHECSVSTFLPDVSMSRGHSIVASRESTGDRSKRSSIALTIDNQLSQKESNVLSSYLPVFNQACVQDPVSVPVVVPVSEPVVVPESVLESKIESRESKESNESKELRLSKKHQSSSAGNNDKQSEVKSNIRTQHNSTELTQIYDLHKLEPDSRDYLDKRRKEIQKGIQENSRRRKELRKEKEEKGIRRQQIYVEESNKEITRLAQLQEKSPKSIISKKEGNNLPVDQEKGILGSLKKEIKEEERVKNAVEEKIVRQKVDKSIPPTPPQPQVGSIPPPPPPPQPKTIKAKEKKSEEKIVRQTVDNSIPPPPPPPQPKTIKAKEKKAKLDDNLLDSLKNFKIGGLNETKAKVVPFGEKLVPKYQKAKLDDNLLDSLKNFDLKGLNETKTKVVPFGEELVPEYQTDLHKKIAEWQIDDDEDKENADDSEQWSDEEVIEQAPPARSPTSSTARSPTSSTARSPTRSPTSSTARSPARSPVQDTTTSTDKILNSALLRRRRDIVSDSDESLSDYDINADDDKNTN